MILIWLKKFARTCPLRGAIKNLIGTEPTLKQFLNVSLIFPLKKIGRENEEKIIVEIFSSICNTNNGFNVPLWFLSITYAEASNFVIYFSINFKKKEFSTAKFEDTDILNALEPFLTAERDR